MQKTLMTLPETQVFFGDLGRNRALNLRQDAAKSIPEPIRSKKYIELERLLSVFEESIRNYSKKNNITINIDVAQMFDGNFYDTEDIQLTYGLNQKKASLLKNKVLSLYPNYLKHSKKVPSQLVDYVYNNTSLFFS